MTYVVTYSDMDRPGRHTTTFRPVDRLDAPARAFVIEMSANGFDVFDVVLYPVPDED